MKKLVKTILYKLGLIRLIHKIKNKNTLTIIMLHRVLPPHLITQYGANTEWTMTPDILESFFVFIKKYYNPVSAKDVENHIYHNSPLPNNAILITFDDGWQDNYEYAEKILTRQKIPSLIFIVSDTINQTLPFWQELIYSCCSKSEQHFTHCKKLAGTHPEDDLLTFIATLEKDIPQNKIDLVINYCKEMSTNLERQILTEKEIQALTQHAIEIGSHGASHKKLGTLPAKEQQNEITQSRKTLEKITKKPVTFISFPHGSSDKHTAQLCKQAGYTLCFNSHVALNKTRQKNIELARIHVSQSSLTTNMHQFNEMKACYRLFFLNHV